MVFLPTSIDHQQKRQQNLVPRSGSFACLFLPTTYAAYVVGMSLKLLAKEESPFVMTRVLRMERLVKEGRKLVQKQCPRDAHLYSVVFLSLLNFTHTC